MVDNDTDGRDGATPVDPAVFDDAWARPRPESLPSADADVDAALAGVTEAAAVAEAHDDAEREAENEATQVVPSAEPDAPVALEAPEGAAAEPPVSEPAAAETVVAPAAAAVTSPEVDAERQRLQAERAARREARLAALAPTPPAVPEPAAEATTVAPAVGAAAYAPLPATVETVTVTQRSTDKFTGSLGLFLLRLVTAGIIGLYGMTHLLQVTATTELIATTILPEPGILAIVLGAAEVAIAIALLFGLLTRLAGLGLMLVAGSALGFVLWGPWSPFTAGQVGFTGQFELLLVAVGALFLFVGAGGWSIDRGFRTRRAEARNR